MQKKLFTSWYLHVVPELVMAMVHCEHLNSDLKNTCALLDLYCSPIKILISGCDFELALNGFACLVRLT